MRTMAVPIRQIAEVAIVVTDLDRSVRFYTEVLGLPLWERAERNATVRLANGFLGLWLPGAWEIPPSANSAAIRLDGGARQHIVFYIDLDDADAALANLQRHGVRYYGPRVKEGGEVHIDFEDPDGHMLEYWARASFEPLPDRPPPAGTIDA
jgi:catechol 2,3-dioxygenase-like lactoylglutathione lyase family enzyme